MNEHRSLANIQRREFQAAETASAKSLGPVNKRVSIGRAAREGPVGLRKDFNVIVHNVGSHRRGVRWFCLSEMIPLAILWVIHGIKVARLLR